MPFIGEKKLAIQVESYVVDWVLYRWSYGNHLAPTVAKPSADIEQQ